MTNNNDRIDIQFYNVGKIIFFPSIIISYIFSNYVYFQNIENNSLFECFVRKHFGLICPGCFGTRALVSLFRGDLIKSFIYNPVVIVAFTEYLLFMSIMFFRINIKKNIVSKKMNVLIFIYILIAVLIIQWLIKLVLYTKGVFYE